jgi:hypothetical protein
MPSLWDYTQSIILSNDASVEEIHHVEFSLLSDMPVVEKHALIMASTNRYKLHLDNLRSCGIHDFIEVASTLPDTARLHVDLKIVAERWTLSVDNRLNWKFSRALPPPAAGEIRASLISR